MEKKKIYTKDVKVNDSIRKKSASRKKKKNLCMTEIIMLNERKELQISE